MMEFLSQHWETILTLVVAIVAGKLGHRVVLLSRIIRAVIAGVESGGHIETKRNIKAIASDARVEFVLHKLVKQFTARI